MEREHAQSENCCLSWEALAAVGIEVDKKDITVEAAKELGTYEATVKCFRDVKGTFKYEIVAE